MLIAFELDGDEFELRCTVRYQETRGADWAIAVSRGVGLVFDDIDDPTADQLRSWVKDRVGRFSL